MPVPEVASLAELNQRLRACCERDVGRRIGHRAETVGEALARAANVAGAAGRAIGTAEEATPRVSAKALVTVRTNQYSVPVALAGLRVRARIGAGEIAISWS